MKFSNTMRFLCFIVFALFAGCIKEDAYNCDYELDVELAYQPLGDTKNPIDQYIETAAILVYDIDGNFVQSTNIENVGDLAASSYVERISLNKRGDYNIVVIGDTQDDDYVLNTRLPETREDEAVFTSDLDAMIIGLSGGGSRVSTSLSDVYLAERNVVNVNPYSVSKYTALLSRKNKCLILEIEGLVEEKLSEEQIEIVIRGIGNSLNADGKLVNTDDTSEFVPYEISCDESGYIKTKNDFFGMILDQPIQLDIRLTTAEGQLITKSLNLMDLIAQNPATDTQEELDAIVDYNIKLDFYTYADLRVTVNGWEIKPTTPEL